MKSATGERALICLSRGQGRRCSHTTRLSMAAADITRRVVKLAASTNPGANASRHRIELAAKQTMAPLVNPMVRHETAPGTDPPCKKGAHITGAARRAATMQSASRAASSPMPDMKEEFIFDSHGKPRK